MRKDVPVSQFLDSMIARAKADKKTIVLPEGNDIRTLKAAEAILAEGIADLIVLGDADDITAAGCNLEGARIVDFRTSELREPYAEKLAELRAAPPRPPRALLFWDWADFSSLPFFLFSLDAEFLEEFVAAVDAELLVDVADVRLRRAVGHDHGRGHLAGRAPL